MNKKRGNIVNEKEYKSSKPRRSSSAQLPKRNYTKKSVNEAFSLIEKNVTNVPEAKNTRASKTKEVRRTPVKIIPLEAW